MKTKHLHDENIQYGDFGVHLFLFDRHDEVETNCVFLHRCTQVHCQIGLGSRFEHKHAQWGSCDNKQFTCCTNSNTLI